VISYAAVRTRQRPLQRRLPMPFNGPDNPQNFPFPLGDLHLHLIHGFLGPPEFSSKTLSRSVQLFLHSAPLSVITLQWAATFPRQNCPFPWGIESLSNTWYLGPARVITPNGILIGSAVFVWVPNNALSMGKKTLKIVPLGISSPRRRRTEPRRQAACIKLGKDRACGSGDMLADRQTHTYTDVLITILRHRYSTVNSNYDSHGQVVICKPTTETSNSILLCATVSAR